jgi:type II secretory pathway pseudopilin PulG
MAYRSLSQTRGFLLVEVVVMVAIVALLGTVVAFNVADARKESRDTQRLSDMEQLKITARLYKDANGSLPIESSGIYIDDAPAELVTGYLTKEIQDPLWDGSGANRYGYFYISNYSCNGTPHTMLIVRVEKEETSNWEEICGVSEPAGFELYGVILQ